MTLLVPTFVPFTFHWYEGVVPPLVGDAVNVTDVPAQTGFAEEAMETEAVTFGFTDIAIEFDVAGEPETQVAFEVKIQVIASPLIGV